MSATVFISVLVVVVLCVIGLGVNIFFRKKDFPHYDVGSNEEMRSRGIRCYKDEDAALHNNKCSSSAATDACKECKLYEQHSSDSGQA